MSGFVDPQRVRGTLLGLAWGDVFGCPVEYWTPGQIAGVYGRYEQLPESYPLERIATDLRGHLRPLGLHSDDTQQALALMHTCLRPEGWHVLPWAGLLVEGERRKAWRGTGRNFRAAVRQMKEGRPPLECGSPTAGIGAAMRIAPLGALYAADLQRLAQVAGEASRSTHADVRAISFAFAVAACCAMQVQGRGLDETRAALPDQVKDLEMALAGSVPVADESHLHAVSRALNDFLGRDWKDPAELRAALASSAGEQGIAIGDGESASNHPFVLLGGVHALCMGLWPEGEPQALLSDLVQQGGDTDTAAAIAGGVLGARFGTDWIPLARCSDAAMLQAYADSLLSGQLPEDEPAFLERERTWSSLERRYASGLAATGE